MRGYKIDEFVLLFVRFDFLRPSQQFFSHVVICLPGINVSCSLTQRSAVGEARTRNPSISSQELYKWATALPRKNNNKKLFTLSLNWTTTIWLGTIYIISSVLRVLEL